MALVHHCEFNGFATFEPMINSWLCKGKYYWMADLLFDWFRFSYFALLKLSTDWLFRSYPNQSNERSAQQWYFPLQTKQPFLNETNRETETLFSERWLAIHVSGENGPDRRIWILQKSNFMLIFVRANTYQYLQQDNEEDKDEEIVQQQKSGVGSGFQNLFSPN